jgi:hypothetical protein
MSLPGVTLKDLQTFYSVEDVYDMLEVAAVNAHNREVMSKRRRDD